MKKNKGKSILYLAASLVLLLSMVGGSWVTANAAEDNFVIPTISILSVVTDSTVTIRTYNYPANDNFNVYMGEMHTQGIGGIFIETINSGSGGTFDKTFNIPDALKGRAQIAIRLESPTSGFFSYNWFWNNTSGGGTIPDTGGSYSGYPTFSITTVVPDTTVTVLTNNLPPNDNFNVLMNYMGTQGKNGINVGTVASGAGGAISFTFNIPAELKGQAQIAIRMESPTSAYFAYNWFYNVSGGTIPDTGTGAPPPGTIPTFMITAVVKDSTVSIQTANFPSNDTFNVLMGDFGTKAVGGASAGSVNSGSGGVLNFTFTIPDSQKGKNPIAIRLESPTSGYFSYNWFYNNNAP